jgi:ligand-binding SRPBCC domain-containing protein
MPIHTLHRKQVLPITRATAWDFFSNPRNLARITPPSLDFQILTPDLPEKIRAGMMIQYRVRPLLRIPMTWLTEITQVQDGEYFVDEQRVGPYSIWHHEHEFREIDGGKVEIEDRVTYTLPFGWLSEPIHALIVRHQLAAIFDYRTVAVTELFPAPRDRPLAVAA